VKAQLKASLFATQNMASLEVFMKNLLSILLCSLYADLPPLFSTEHQEKQMEEDQHIRNREG
jgi:hypothetical protein